MDTGIYDSLTRGLAKNILIQRAGRGPPPPHPFFNTSECSYAKLGGFLGTLLLYNMGKYVLWYRCQFPRHLQNITINKMNKLVMSLSTHTMPVLTYLLAVDKHTPTIYTRVGQQINK